MAQRALTAVLAAFLWMGTAFAHHPFSEEFDTSKTVTLMGTVTRVEWTNPHVFAYVDVKDNQGKLVNWKVEMGSPSELERTGWSRTSVKTGDQVTIKGWAAKNGANVANADSFMLPGGKTIAAASSFHIQPASQTARDAAADQRATGTSGAAEGLPATASPMALYFALGALSLVGALGLRALRR